MLPLAMGKSQGEEKSQGKGKVAGEGESRRGGARWHNTPYSTSVGSQRTSNENSALWVPKKL